MIWCRHKNVTFPQTDRATKLTTQTCLDCTKTWTYDLGAWEPVTYPRLSLSDRFRNWLDEHPNAGELAKLAVLLGSWAAIALAVLLFAGR